MSDRSEPRTAAGRALAAELDVSAWFVEGGFAEAILAIEAEAAAPHEARLREALAAYELLAQQLHAAAFDDPDMGTREWERKLDAEWAVARALATEGEPQ